MAISKRKVGKDTKGHFEFETNIFAREIMKANIFQQVIIITHITQQQKKC